MGTEKGKRTIRYAGHTMGLPGYDIYRSIDFCKRIGFDAVEVRMAADGQIDSETVTDGEAAKIGAYAEKQGMDISCLNSYFRNFTDLNERPKTIAKLKRVAELAAVVKAPLIRLYGGVEPFTQDKVWFVDNWTRSVDGVREVAEYAARFGVRVCIETHVNSLTMSVRDTVRFIEDVAMPNVGMLLDYAWVEMAGVEVGAEAVRKAAGHIFHVHFKDWVCENRFPLKKRACLMGEGTVRWPEVLTALREIGYTGYLCDEYERYWHPEELPAPEIGMKHDLEYVKKFFAE